MPDVFTKAKRSEVMSRIRGSGNRKTELALIAVFRRNHIIGWRRHQQVLGKPDFVFRSMRLAVFVDGCFWHRCPKHCSMPVNNRVFWAKKLETNKLRDRNITKVLQEKGWKVLRIWEHELSPRNEKRLLNRLQRHLDGGCHYGTV